MIVCFDCDSHRVTTFVIVSIVDRNGNAELGGRIPLCDLCADARAEERLDEMSRQLVAAR